MTIRTKADENKRQEERLEVLKNIKSHEKVGLDSTNGSKDESNQSAFQNYFKQVMIFNSTPKVNLVG